VVGGVTCALVAGVASASVELVAIAALRSGRNSEDSWLTRSSSCLVTDHFRAAIVLRKYMGAHANSTRRYMHRLRKPGARVAERRQLQSHSKKLTCSTGALISHALDLTRQPSPQNGILRHGVSQTLRDDLIIERARRKEAIGTKMSSVIVPTVMSRRSAAGALSIEIIARSFSYPMYMRYS
jgi:hypothetical protein